MKTIKILCVFGLILLIAGTAFAGGGGQGSARQTIVVGGWPSGDVAFRAIIPAFQRLHPNIEVELEFMETTAYQQALTTALAAGTNAPDVAAINEMFVSQYKNLPVLDDLEEGRAEVGQLVKLAGILSGVRTKATRNGSLMAYATLEDRTGSVELLIFSSALSGNISTRWVILHLLGNSRYAIICSLAILPVPIIATFNIEISLK